MRDYGDVGVGVEDGVGQNHPLAGRVGSWEVGD